MIHSSSSNVDVLIVGAGPVGLFLANECARRNLRWRIVEAHAGQSEHSKALAIFPRTLEIFDMADLVPAFLEAANRVNAVAVMSHDRTLARIRFEPEQTPYPFVAMVPQDVTESLLAEALHRRGGMVEYNTSFVSLEQSADTVSITVERDGVARDHPGCICCRLRRRAQRRAQISGHHARRRRLRCAIHARRY